MKKISVIRMLFAGLLSLGALPVRANETRPANNAAAGPAKVLAAQTAAWNSCDIDGFMAGYWHSKDLRFASGDKVTYGWEKTLQGYKARYADCAKMGQLSFSDIETRTLSPTAVQVFGHWSLARAGDHPHGLFTLLFQKFGDDWRIISDHTSAANHE